MLAASENDHFFFKNIVISWYFWVRIKPFFILSIITSDMKNNTTACDLSGNILTLFSK